MKNLKVIFHIDDKERWGMVLSNVKNLLAEVNEDQVDIEVLANGKAVEKYSETTSKSDDNNLMKKLAKRQVKFVACNNSLNGLNLKKDEIYEFITIVSAGVLELTIKQNEGYAYIKP